MFMHKRKKSMLGILHISFLWYITSITFILKKKNALRSLEMFLYWKNEMEEMSVSNFLQSGLIYGKCH